MARNEFELNGPQRNRTQRNVAMRRIAALCAMFAGLALNGCVTTGSTATTTKTICKPWRSITYSSSKDTAATVYQIRVHNRTGERLRCPNW